MTKRHDEWTRGDRRAGLIALLAVLLAIVVVGLIATRGATSRLPTPVRSTKSAGSPSATPASSRPIASVCCAFSTSR